MEFDNTGGDYLVTNTAPSSSSGFGDALMGGFQQALALGTGYLSRRIDVDLQRRLAGAQPTGDLQPTKQSTLSTTGSANAGGGMRMADLLPIALIVGVGLVLFRRRRG